MSQTSDSKSRVLALDLARGLALLFMVWVHVLEEWATLPLQRSAFGRVVEFFGSSPAAPVFMGLMGASIAFSRRGSTVGLVRRGLELLGLAFLLNFLRGSLLAQIGLSLGLVQAEAIAPYTPWNLFWIVDILGFAGPALILLGLIRRIDRPLLWVSLAAVVALVSPSLWGIESDWAPWNGVLRHLWGTGPMVSFPMFPWLAYPLVGMAWGRWLAVTDDEDRFFRWTLLGGVILMGANTGFLLDRGDQLLGNHWRLGFEGVAWIVGFVAAWLFLCQRMVRTLPANRFFDLLGFWSRNVTRFYVIQWLIIAWGTGLAGYHELGLGPIIAGQLVVPALAHGVTRASLKWRERRSGK